MKNAVLFKYGDILPALPMRVQLLRVPEVSVELKKFQNLLQEKSLDFNLEKFFKSPEEVFCEHSVARDFVQAIVHRALYRRYLKVHGKPDYIIAPAGRMSVVSMMQQEADDKILSYFPRVGLKTDSGMYALNLTGAIPEKYVIYKKTSTEQGMFPYVKMKERANLLPKMCTYLDDYKVNAYVAIGAFSGDLVSITGCVETVSWLEMDPLLDWFWPAVEVSEKIA